MDDEQGDEVTLSHLNKSTIKKKKDTCPRKKWTDIQKKKKKFACSMSVHEQNWTDTLKKKKKKDVACTSMTQKKKKLVACPSLNKSGRTKKKEKNEVACGP